MKNFDLTKKYERKIFTDFLSDFLPDDFEAETEEIYFDYTNIEEGIKLGSSESLSLEVFEFRTKGNRDPRISLTKEVVSLMKKLSYMQNALVIFYSDESKNYRLSLITSDFELINGKIKALYSNPKRFSFRLGDGCKSHTPSVMLFEKGKIRQ